MSAEMLFCSTQCQLLWCLPEQKQNCVSKNILVLFTLFKSTFISTTIPKNILETTFNASIPLLFL